MVSFPVELLLGRLTITATLQGFGIQVAWIIAVSGLFAVMWRKGIARYSAVGT
jgi:ABC-2 type transport system permease protein